jgi:hypothetical protein
MTKVTIAKALNVKNRILGEKNRLMGLISQNASRLEVVKTNYDVKELWSQYEASVAKLIAVKSAIAKANVNIYDKIYRISELKSKSAQINNLSTDETPYQEVQQNRVTGEITRGPILNRVVLFTDKTLAEHLKAIETEIASLHDEVTAYNYNTTIEIPD